MIIFNVYITIGLVFATLVFGLVILSNRLDYVYSKVEHLVDRHTFPIVATVAFLTFIVFWPGWILFYIKNLNT